MVTTVPMPDAAKVRHMLGLLFDGLDVKPGKRFDLAPASGAWVGLYVGADGAPLALCAVDAALAGYAGAALSMLPPAAAKDAVKAKDLSDVMVANLREVMNICSRLVMNDTSPHVRLEEIHPSARFPAGVNAVLGGQKGRVDFELNVPKYGPGTLAVVAV
jgi:hypothetical protein